MVGKKFPWQESDIQNADTGDIDRLWVLGFLLAALVIYGINLGGLPLRDWDEGIVAQVARNIWRSADDPTAWLYPTLGGEPYLNKPPLMHWLIALTYGIGGVNEWTTRLPGAILTAFSVPLLYGIGRELFFRRPPAVFATLVYLTLLPVVRHGRLAMLDGAILCFFLLMLWCLLRSRRDLRWGLGVGIGFGLMCLTKGILGVLLGAIGFLFILWDTPRLLTSTYVWMGVILGSTPVALWFTAQWVKYGQGLLDNLQGQSFSRLWTAVESNAAPPWYYLLEIAKYSLPWLLFLPGGFRLAWDNRGLGWAKLVLIWSGGFLGVISLMGTKLPWYVLPIYPALALVCGVYLAEIWRSTDMTGLPHPPARSFPLAWLGLFALLTLAGWAGCLYFGTVTPRDPNLQGVLGSLALTLTIVTFLISRRDSQFTVVLGWGCYLTLCMLMLTSHWVWELAEAYPVKPVAALLQQATPNGKVIYTSYPYYRPSLNFYSDRRVLPTPSVEELQKQWLAPKPYLLLEESALSQLALPDMKIIGTAVGWSLVTRDLPASETSARTALDGKGQIQDGDREPS